MKLIFTLFILVTLVFLNGCDQKITTEKIEPMTLKCHNSLDSEMWHTTLVFHHNTVDIDDNWGGVGNSEVEVKKLNISESNIHIELEFDETKKQENVNKKITESWDINRFTGKYKIHLEHFRVNGTKDLTDWNGDCTKEDAIRKF